MPLSPALLVVVWSLFVILAVGGFLMIAAYWLDVQDRPDLRTGARIAWSAGVVVFPVAIPAYAFFGGASWPLALRIGSIVPVLAVGLFLAFALGYFT
jgi:hypothetical protein